MSNSSAYENLEKHCELYPESYECKLLQQVIEKCPPEGEPGKSGNPYEDRNVILNEIAEYLLIFTRQSQELQASHYTALATLSKNYKEFPQLTDFFAELALDQIPETDHLNKSIALQLRANAFRQQNLFEQADQALAQAESLIALERLQIR